MNDNEHIALGRVESFGSGITVVLWDLLGNERMRCVTHEIAVNPDARISFVAASEDSCFIAAAFQNDYDDWAKFVVFNMSYDSIIPAKIITLNSLAEVSTVIDVQEMVTGTRQGELIIWSLSGCKILRHFYSAPSPNPGLMSKGTARSRIASDGGRCIQGSSTPRLRVRRQIFETLVPAFGAAPSNSRGTHGRGQSGSFSSVQ